MRSKCDAAGFHAYTQRQNPRTSVAKLQMFKKPYCNTFVALIALAAPGIFRDTCAESGRDIRDVDFRNFSYPVSGVAAEVTRARSIRVKQGIFAKEWEEKHSLGSMTKRFTFSVNSVSYGDIDHDGTEDAVIDTSFSWMGGYQQDASQMYVYTVKSGGPELIGVPDIGAQIERDFARLSKSKGRCEDGVYSWSVVATREGLIKAEAIIGNPHVCFDEEKGYSMASMTYRLEANRWVLVKALKRWRKNS